MTNEIITKMIDLLTTLRDTEDGEDFVAVVQDSVGMAFLNLGVELCVSLGGSGESLSEHVLAYAEHCGEGREEEEIDRDPNSLN